MGRSDDEEALAQFGRGDACEALLMGRWLPARVTRAGALSWRVVGKMSKKRGGNCQKCDSFSMGGFFSSGACVIFQIAYDNGSNEV